MRADLSAIEFTRGACGAVVATSVPQAVSTASDAAVNLESRSRIRRVNPRPGGRQVGSEVAGQLRGPGGSREPGNAQQVHVPRSMTTAACSRVSDAAQSMWKKSTARIVVACAQEGAPAVVSRRRRRYPV